jgi:hypothetical protein
MKKRGQVWIETVTYTLIAFMLIGLVLAYAKPKIEELQDKVIIDQSIKMLKDIDFVSSEVGEGSVGNKRKIQILLKKGSLELNPLEDLIIFHIQSRYTYSEPGEGYEDGGINVLTQTMGKYNNVTLTLNYSGTYNITHNDLENSKTLSKSSTPYNLFISNKGGDTVKLDIEID